MPGPNSGKTGKVCFGRSRPRGQQMTEREQLEATQKYVARSNKRASSSVKTKQDKLRRQMSREDDAA
jgi:hypothetical protein